MKTQNVVGLGFFLMSLLLAFTLLGQVALGLFSPSFHTVFVLIAIALGIGCSFVLTDHPEWMQKFAQISFGSSLAHAFTVAVLSILQAGSLKSMHAVLMLFIGALFFLYGMAITEGLKLKQ